VAAVGLATVSATVASAAPPPPAPGIAPAVVRAAGTDLFYTAAGGTVWTLVPGGTATQVSNGRVLGAVSGLYNGSLILFGEGTDHQLWSATRVGTTWSPWTSLGGNLTSQPGAVYRGSTAIYSVFARGADGAVWARDHSSAGWGAWHSIGGQLYGGTGPSAAYLGGGTGTYVLVTGTDKQLYIAHAGVTGFTAAGGQTTVSPALTAIPGAFVGFVRGTDSAAYYHRFLNTSPGWHKIGGIFSTGLGAANVGGSLTNTVGLGTDSQVYLSAGNWATYPPTFSGWARETS
jgi:hypothetical protein